MSTPPAPSSPLEDTVAIVGVGLIGGSIAAAARQRGVARQVIGVGRDRQRLDAAQARGLIDRGMTDLAAAARESQLLIFCTPVDRIVAGLREAAPHCRPGTLLTDAGSIKGAIVRELPALDGGVTFIGSHPLAGSEKQGLEHADPHLYENRVCVITPDENLPPSQVERLRRFWQALGMRVLSMSPEDHDRALAATSHLPHLVASALAATLTEPNRPLAATGFRDCTRIAAADPDLWRAILLTNAAEVLRSLDLFTAELARFRTALEQRDAAALKLLLQHAKRNRDALES